MEEENGVRKGNLVWSVLEAQQMESLEVELDVIIVGVARSLTVASEHDGWCNIGFLVG